MNLEMQWNSLVHFLCNISQLAERDTGNRELSGLEYRDGELRSRKTKIYGSRATSDESKETQENRGSLQLPRVPLAKYRDNLH
jgi:hypothetical protein